jgi:hypothetical protein
VFSLYLELKKREESLALYDKEVINPETGETLYGTLSAAKN